LKKQGSDKFTHILCLHIVCTVVRQDWKAVLEDVLPPRKRAGYHAAKAESKMRKKQSVSGLDISSTPEPCITADVQQNVEIQAEQDDQDLQIRMTREAQKRASDAVSAAIMTKEASAIGRVEADRDQREQLLIDVAASKEQ
jgi:hypothetical protein